MAQQTLYIVQSFSLSPRGLLKADPPEQKQSAESARRMAERLAETKAGVVAYAATADADLGEYDRPEILFKAGQLPDTFED